MSKRGRMSRGYSRKVFTRGAKRIHGKNDATVSFVMRGGVRL